MSGFNKLSDWEKLNKPQRQHILKMMAGTVGPLVEVSKINNSELAEMLFEVSETGLLPAQYASACLEAAMRLAEEGTNEQKSNRSQEEGV